MSITTELVIQNQKGLHARAAAAFVNAVADLDAEVWVEKDGQEVEGNSILGLMMLAASKGSIIKVRADGKDAEQAVANLTGLVNSLFGETL
jgi:phosphocarrier protein